MFDSDESAAESPVHDVYEEETAPVRSAGVKLYYCPECDNMMEPLTPMNRGEPLQYYCRSCNATRIPDDQRVYVNVLKLSAKQSFLSKRQLAADPTLRRTRRFCSQCGRENTVVEFMAPVLKGEDAMHLMMECTLCHHQERIFFAK